MNLVHIYSVKYSYKKEIQMKNFIKLSVISTLLSTTLALADNSFDLEKEQSKLSYRVFEYYDTNRDKTLSLDEFVRFSKEIQKKEQEKLLAKTLKSCDKNKNKQIEASEIPTDKELEEAFKKDFYNAEKMCPLDKIEFDSIQKEHNDFITKEELLQSYNQRYFGMWNHKPTEEPKEDKLKHFKERLKECDKNKDGSLTLIEATADLCYMSSEDFLNYSKSPDESFVIDEISTISTNQEMEQEERFKHCDSNSDNKLNLVEATSLFCTMTSDEFIKLDSDHNNYIDPTEIKKMYEEASLNTPVKIVKEMPPIVQISIALNQCDEDKNRILTKDEAELCELPMATFEKYDFDKSNSVEDNDMKMAQNIEAFNQVDINGNQKLEAEEFEERMGNRCRSF